MDSLFDRPLWTIHKVAYPTQADLSVEAQMEEFEDEIKAAKADEDRKEFVSSVRDEKRVLSVGVPSISNENVKRTTKIIKT